MKKHILFVLPTLIAVGLWGILTAVLLLILFYWVMGPYPNGLQAAFTLFCCVLWVATTQSFIWYVQRRVEEMLS